MIVGLFKLMIFLVVVFLAVICFTVLGLLHKLRKTAEKMKQDMNGDSVGASRQGADEVIDTRGKAQSGKKIFGKDEGEYVDFTEE